MVSISATMKKGGRYVPRGERVGEPEQQKKWRDSEGRKNRKKGQ